MARLLDEIARIDSTKDGELVLGKYAEAASLVDRSQKPLKWAALRLMYGAVAFNIPARREAALVAFRDSLPCWDPVTQRTQWAECKSYIGWTLYLLGRQVPPDSEEAIECLEATLSDYPDGTADKLATYYSLRTIGDPHDNWRKWVDYLDAALTRLSPQSDPVDWARLRNDQANALRREPAGDFPAAVEKGIVYHDQALAVLTPALRESSPYAAAMFIKVSIDASEAWLSRVTEHRAESLMRAGQLARGALAACGAATPRDARAFAAMAMARVLLDEHAAPTAEQCAEALSLCAGVDPLYASGEAPAMLASNWRFKALAYLQLLKLGSADHLEQLLSAVESACALIDPAVDPSTYRVVTRIAADGLLLRKDYARAIGYLKRAQDAGERALGQARSRAGRLECIFNLHDVSARLGYCLFSTGDVPGGLEAIDRNKARFWRPDEGPATFAQIKELAPEHGALIFPSFGPEDAWVVIVTRAGEKLCRLEGLDLTRLHGLLLKDIRDPQSDAWMSRYEFRHANPAQWTERIDTMGKILFESFWSPVFEALQTMGVTEGAELVCFPQAGLGVLPLHAAWTPSASGRRWIGDDYALRYAPSARCLVHLQTTPGKALSGNAILVSNPPTPFRSLAYADLEMALVRASLPAALTRELQGSQADTATVLAALPKAGLVHFATHGLFNITDPFLSSLVLANGELLSLDALLPVIQNSNVQQVVLSACETAVVSSWRRVDEMIGFPAAFLEHGACTVLATLWPVEDLAAALLVGRFYREWRSASGPTPAQALRAAQNWMREATSDVLCESLSDLVDAPEPVGGLVCDARNRFFSMAADGRPLAHPQHWAAFTVSGL